MTPFHSIRCQKTLHRIRAERYRDYTGFKNETKRFVEAFSSDSNQPFNDKIYTDIVEGYGKQLYSRYTEEVSKEIERELIDTIQARFQALEWEM